MLYTKKKQFKIGIDARMYAVAGGIGRYTRELIKGLEKFDQQNSSKASADRQYVIFLDKKGFREYIPKNKNFKKVLTDVKWYSLAEQIKMPKIWKKENLDLIHFTHFNKSIFYRRPYIVTIHDLTYTQQRKLRISKLPLIIYELKYCFYERLIKDTIIHAQKIIVPTNYSKKDVVETYGIDPAKIVVTYESAGEGFSPDKKPDVFKKIIKKFSIKAPYFIYVGNAAPHKNLKILVESFIKLLSFLKATSSKVDVQLVLVGKKDKFYQELEEWIGMQDIEQEKIILTGMVDDEELQVLLSNAYTFIFPSLAEGFGIPPLEAMASGIPVLVSNATCLPEVCEDAALYFNPLSIDDIAEKMRKIIEDKKLREDLINRGLKHVKKFSWDKMAKETLTVYKDVLDNL